MTRAGWPGRYRDYRPALFSYRIVDREAGLFEIVDNRPWPHRSYLVLVAATERGVTLSCTCPCGRAGFRRTMRGFCKHVDALMTFGLQYRGTGEPTRTFSFGYVYEPGMGLD